LICCLLDCSPPCDRLHRAWLDSGYISNAEQELLARHAHAEDELSVDQLVAVRRVHTKLGKSVVNRLLALRTTLQATALHVVFDRAVSTQAKFDNEGATRLRYVRDHGGLCVPRLQSDQSWV
jgi:hypothetical protein